MEDGQDLSKDARALPSKERHKPYSCQKCSKQFLNQHRLNFHMIRHSKKDQPYSCPTCGKKFFFHRNLKHHVKLHLESMLSMTNVTLEQNDYMCVECGKQFSEQARLESHVGVHRAITTHACSICGRNFVSQIALKVHKSRHSKTSFSCAICGRVYLRESQLRNHVKIHTSQRDYACKQCGRRFIWKSQLEKHYDTHSKKSSEEDSHVDIKTEPFALISEKCGKRFAGFSELDLQERLCSTVGIKTSTAESDFASSSKTLTANTSQKGYHKATSAERKDFRNFACLDSSLHRGNVTAIQSIENPTNATKDKYEITDVKNEHKQHTKIKRPILSPYHCPECGKQYVNAQGLMVHVRVHDNIMPFICSVCKQDFQFLRSLRMHMRTHSNARPRVCPYCGKLFGNPSNLLQHIRIHTGDKRFKCSKCEKSFIQRSQLKTHMRTHDSSKPYSCHKCGKKLKCVAGLKQHLKRHELKDRIVHRENSSKLSAASFAEDCRSLKESTVFQPTVMIELDSEGNSIQQAHSVECMKDSTPLRRVTKVLKTWQNVYKTVEKLECVECSKVFSNLGALETHMLQHGVKKLYPCSECDRRFSQLGSLKMHSRIHTGEKPCICPQCGKAFRSPGNLQQHRRIHTGERPYACEECGRRFTQKSQMKTHMKTHSGEKPYQCKVCGKSFGYVISLKAHMRTHNNKDTIFNDGEILQNGVGIVVRNVDFSPEENETNSPFQCDHYSRNFTRCKHLKDHLRIHTSGKYSSCEKCGNRCTQKSEAPYVCEKCGKQFGHFVGVKSHSQTQKNGDDSTANISTDSLDSFQNSTLFGFSSTGNHNCTSGNLHQKVVPTLEIGDKDIPSLEIQTSDKLEWFAESKPIPSSSSGRRKQKRPQKLKDIKVTAEVSSTETVVNTPKYSTNMKTYQLIKNGLKVYACPTCQKSFTQSGNLMLHLRTHTGEKPHPCSFCQKRFRNPSNLQQHMRTHTGERPYPCDQCDRRFAQKSQMKTHLKTHTREKPFVCEKCGKSFGYAISLRSHIKNNPCCGNAATINRVDIVSPSAPSVVSSSLWEKSSNGLLTCGECHKTFVNMNSLKLHTRTHTGEKPCACQYCGKSFAHPSNLTCHIRIHTGEKPFECKICQKDSSNQISYVLT